MSRLGPSQETERRTERRQACNKRSQSGNIICQKKGKFKSATNDLGISLNHRISVYPLSKLSLNFTPMFHVTDGNRLMLDVILFKLVSSFSV